MGKKVAKRDEMSLEREVNRLIGRVGVEEKRLH